MIDIYCEVDGGIRKFASSKKIYLGRSRAYKFISYTCRNCGNSSKTFALVFEWPYFPLSEQGDVKVMKLGEFPPFSASISPRIRKLLSEEDLELYRRGSRAMAQGLGIGAASYFRRIVEGQRELLVKEIRNAANRLGYQDLSVYDAALEATNFSDAATALKDVIPEKLLILDGQNPLTLLYRPLSEQLHDLSDEQCLQQAQDIRLVLTALLENIAVVLRDQKELQAAASRLQSPTK